MTSTTALSDPGPAVRTEPGGDPTWQDRATFENMLEGFAYCQMIFENGEAHDFVYLAVNPAFEKLTGLKNVTGKRATEVIPGIRETDPELLRTYGRVALTGVPEKFEMYVEALQSWFSISAYSPRKGFFVAMFDVISGRKRAEKALRDSQEALLALFDDAPLPSHEIDRNGIVLRVNRTECDMLGVEAAEMIGRPIWDFVSPEEREESRAVIARKLLGPRVPAPTERKFRSPSGAEFFFQLHDRLTTDAAGHVVGIRTEMIDLTQAKRLNARLDKERGLLRALMDQSPDHIYFKDADGRFTLVNAAMARLLGCGDPSQVIGKSDFDFFSPEHAAPAHADERDLMQERVRAVTKEEKETWPDGRETWVHTTKLPLRDSSGRITGTFGISRDITQRRRMEQAFRESEDRLTLAQEALNIGTWDLDLATDRAKCSEQLPKLYGRSGKELNSEQWLSSVHPDDRRWARSSLNESVRTGQPLTRRFRVVWPDGSLHWLQSMSRVMRDAEDKPARVVGIDFDITDQARNEERLRILSTAVEQSPASIVITDLQGNIEYVNPKVTETTGYTAQELIGRNPRILKSGETPDEEYQNLWHTIRAGEWRGTFHNRRKNGELFWEAAAISPICDPSGAPTHYLAVKEDITARKLAEDKIAWLASFPEQSPHPIVEIEVTGGVVHYVNPAARDLFPDLRQQGLAHGWLASLEQVAETLTRADTHEARRDVIAGDLYWAQTIQYLPGARRLRVYGKDITDRKRAENALRESELKYRTLVKHLPQRIIYKDRESVYISCNDLFAQELGIAAGDIAGKTDFDFYPPELAKKYRADDRRIMELGRAVELEEEHVSKGKPCTVFTLKTPVMGVEGAVIGVLGVFTDITERKRAEEALRESERQLRLAQKLEAIGQLAAGIAHEINTPVQYIGDNAQFLSGAFQDLLRVIDRNGSADDVDVEYLRAEIPTAIGQLQEGVGRVAGIVRAMKRFSHPGPAEKVPIDIHQAIESTIVVSRNEWKYVADLTTDFDPDMPPVPCVAGEFNQVVLNLIVNAAHAIADVMKGSGGGKGTIRICTRRNGDFAEIRVGDNGGGIPEDIRSKVFDPFFTTKPVGKGTGQGLAIAHSVIVQKHQGTIGFESETGQGTTFVIQLPLIQGTEGK